MQNAGIIGLFRHIDVSMPGTIAPKGITDIPTLIISNIQEPLVGQQAFLWVENTKKWQEQNSRVQKMIQSNIYQFQHLKSNNSQNNNKESDKLLGYVDNEMTGFSDKFCLLKEDSALPQNFINYGESISIYTAPEEKKIDKNTQASLMQDIMKKRDEQDKINKVNINQTIEKAKSGQLDIAPLPNEHLALQQQAILQAQQSLQPQIQYPAHINQNTRVEYQTQYPIYNNQNIRADYRMQPQMQQYSSNNEINSIRL
jgi:hypothetical protein